jgi:5-methylcytosine-specific restriction protein A
VVEPKTTPRLRGRAGVAQRKRRLAAQPLCVDCLAEDPPRITAATIVDHIIPLSKGGSDDDDNTRNLCDPHNLKRTAEQFGFRQRIEIGEDGWPISP